MSTVWLWAPNETMITILNENNCSGMFEMFKTICHNQIHPFYIATSNINSNHTARKSLETSRSEIIRIQLKRIQVNVKQVKKNMSA